MIAIETMSDQEFEQYALEVLGRELGIDGLARFIRLNRSGTGDYTKDRHEWQKHVMVDEIFEGIRRRQAQMQNVDSEPDAADR